MKISLTWPLTVNDKPSSSAFKMNVLRAKFLRHSVKYKRRESYGKVFRCLCPQVNSPRSLVNTTVGLGIQKYWKCTTEVSISIMSTEQQTVNWVLNINPSYSVYLPLSVATQRCLLVGNKTAASRHTYNTCSISI